MSEPPPSSPLELSIGELSCAICPIFQAKIMLIRATAGTAAKPGRNPASPEAQVGECALQAALPHTPAPSQPCSWPLGGDFPSVLLPPCSSSLGITSLTAWLQVHSHQEVFLSKPFFSASSPRGYIWFLQHNFVYIASGRGRGS